MKTIAVMQPYFFPCIGYWQMMNAVDTWVIYDDVNYIKRGWVNRNRILSTSDETRYINLPLLGASQNKLIKEVSVSRDQKQIRHTLELIKATYHCAPYFNDVFFLILEIMNSKTDNCAAFIEDSFRFLCYYLGIKTDRVLSSDLEKDNSLKGEEKILNICKVLQADRYINAIGGLELYHRDIFKKMILNCVFIDQSCYRINNFLIHFSRVCQSLM